MRALIFPGQGSQFIGMGKDLADAFPIARDVFQEVDEALSQNLSKLMFDGEVEELNLTENTQPALMAVSVAVARVLKSGNDTFLTAATTAFVAGHSLGEYSALTAAGSFKLSDTAKLLRIRGSAMQKAVPVGQGAMAAVLGLSLTEVQAIVMEVAGTDILSAANDNCDGQVVVSGTMAAVERAIALATSKGAKRAIMLAVSAPFHCPLMQPAAVAMEDALAKTEILTPVVPLIANVSALEVTAPDEIRRLLVEQVTGMVRWRESVLYMATKGVTETVEIGAGKVLTGLCKRISKEITAQTVGTPAQIEAFAKTL